MPHMTREYTDRDHALMKHNTGRNAVLRVMCIGVHACVMRHGAPRGICPMT